MGIKQFVQRRRALTSFWLYSSLRPEAKCVYVSFTGINKTQSWTAAESSVKSPCTDSWPLSPDQVRAWEAFEGLDSKVKNLLISLRAVAELQNPAIRDRHWHQLMAATGVRFKMDQVWTLFSTRSSVQGLSGQCFQVNLQVVPAECFIFNQQCCF